MSKSEVSQVQRDLVQVKLLDPKLRVFDHRRRGFVSGVGTVALVDRASALKMQAGLAQPGTQVDCPHCKGRGRIPAASLGPALEILGDEDGPPVVEAPEPGTGVAQDSGEPVPVAGITTGAPASLLDPGAEPVALRGRHRRG